MKVSYCCTLLAESLRVRMVARNAKRSISMKYCCGQILQACIEHRILTHGYGFQNTRCPAIGNSHPTACVPGIHNTRHKSWNTWLIFLFPYVDLSIAVISVLQNTHGSTLGRRGAHLIENKGVNSECKKFEENSRKMASVSTICDEYCSILKTVLVSQDSK